VERAVARVVVAVRGADPEAAVRDLAPGTLAPGLLAELTSPSLFGERTVLVVRAAHELPAELVEELRRYLQEPAEDVALVLVHSGAANRAKALLQSARAAGATEVQCARVARPGERVAFVRAEFQAAGRSISESTARALVDAVGGDLRQLAAACAQLVADTDGPIDAEVVTRYYVGRADVTSFAVADRAVEGRTAEALVLLRWSLSVGVAPVLVTSALAAGLRQLGRVAGAQGLRQADLAREVGVPVWKVERIRQQLRGWTADGMASALQAVALADAAVKGAGDDAGYALERAVVLVGQARGKAAEGR